MDDACGAMIGRDCFFLFLTNNRVQNDDGIHIKKSVSLCSTAQHVQVLFVQRRQSCQRLYFIAIGYGFVIYNLSANGITTAISFQAEVWNLLTDDFQASR